MYLGAPFTFVALQKWPKYRRYYAAVGLGMIAVALVISSFSTRVWHLILTQGVLYAIGGTFLYMPTVVFLDEWFVARKGFGAYIKVSTSKCLLSCSLRSPESQLLKLQMHSIWSHVGWHWGQRHLRPAGHELGFE